MSDNPFHVCKACGVLHAPDKCRKQIYVPPVEETCEFCERPKKNCAGKHQCYESIKSSNATEKAKWQAERAARRAAEQADHPARSNP